MLPRGFVKLLKGLAGGGHEDLHLVAAIHFALKEDMKRNREGFLKSCFDVLSLLWSLSSLFVL